MRSNAEPGLIRIIAQTLCVLIVMNGALLCIVARLSGLAPWSFLAKAFDLLNTALAPTLIAMTLAAVVAALLRPALGLWLSVVTVAAIAWQLTAVLADAAPRRSATGGEAMLRVLTVNAFYNNTDPDRLRSVIEAAEPDVVTIVEGDGFAGDAIERTLPRFHRLGSCDRPPCSITILSRWPAVRVETPMPAAPELPDMLSARLSLPVAMRAGGTIDVVAVHLPRGYRPVAGYFRALVLDALRRSSVTPGVLAGDFNLPTGSAALSQFAAQARLRRADRWIATYPADRPFPAFAAIDHVFVDPAFGVRTCHRLPFAGSDHYGIVCNVVLPRPR